MLVFKNISVLQSQVNTWHTNNEKIAFVATMGGLHDGHLSLIELAKKSADKVVASVFVNPTQFAPHEDFDSYPRDLNQDLDLLSACQADGVFTPDTQQIYPKNMVFNRAGLGKKIYLFEILCGQTRPDFFFGVLQVVRRLFDIVKPDIAVFGQKDYQQFKIIQAFTTDVDIICAATVREDNGLAMSTRNQYLSDNEREIAPKLYQILTRLANAELSKKQAKDALKQYFELDYLTILDADTLDKIGTNTTQVAILCAVFLGSNRLIDNIIYPTEV